MSAKAVALNVTRFVAINLVLLVLTFPLVTLHGPFPNVRNAAVGAVATSMHRGLLRHFMSGAEYNQLIATLEGGGSSRGRLGEFVNNHSRDLALSKITSARYTGYLLEIRDPARVRVGVAQSLGEQGQTVSQIAEAHQAAAAVNAGGFEDPNGTGNGRLPMGVIIHNGSFIAGKDLTAPVKLVGLTKSGALVAGSYTVREMQQMGIAEGISFGPPLIVDGKKQITSGDGGWGIAPRTAIGQRQDGTILLLVIDGRQPEYSLGATLRDVQNVLFENGAYVAANLDGGSSTTLFYQGKVVNRPCDLLGERSIPTALIVK
ncbi:MAG TPA: phosphodiester glycosidase family protein [Bacillota bacterium]|jgi:exopolysaccharide biosynthesis protein